jgi:alpha-galactosidase
VNIPNNGLISDIPDNVVVEVPGWVSKRGVQGIQVGKMPESVMSQILWHRLAEAERAINLALHPSRSQLLNIILYRHTSLEFGFTPPVASYEDGEEVLEKVLQADPELAAILS